MQKLEAIKRGNSRLQEAKLTWDTEHYKTRGHRSEGREREKGPVPGQKLAPGTRKAQLKSTWKENILIKQRHKDKDLIQQQTGLNDWKKSKWEGSGRWLIPFPGKPLEQ